MHVCNQQGSRWRWDEVFLLVATLALLLVRLPFLPRRYFDPDEFEHAHAAWNVFRGLVPYRDFFEHHTPWYYFLLAPFFRFFEVDQSFESARSFLVFARGLSVALTGLAAYLLFRVAQFVGGRRVGLLAGLFLLMQPVLILKTLEIRPDVPALPFFLGGLLCLLRGLDVKLEVDDERAPPLRWFFSGGFLLGGAILCTQKMLFVLPGAFLALGLWGLAGGRARLFGRCWGILFVCAGLLLPLVLTWAAFAVQGGGRRFIFNNFLLNAKWKLHSSRHFQVMLESTWPMLALALVGVVAAVRRFFVEKPAQFGSFGSVLLLGTMAGLFAGLRVVPAAYLQYYLMPLPLACVFAAEGLCVLVRLAWVRTQSWLTALAVVLLLPLPIHHFVQIAANGSERQMERLRYVLARTRPNDLVLDGWRGTQVFRPQPLYYGFLHREILAMLTGPEIDAYLGPLERGEVRPALIDVDVDLRYLGLRFTQYLQANYVSNDGEFYWPKVRAPLRPPDHQGDDEGV